MTRQDLDYYVEQFKKSGFRGPLNWYRSVEENWKWRCSVPHRKILAPALMVTASFDVVLTPKSSQLMEPWVPNLTRANLDCGHWTMVEKPKELNEILVKWLNKVHKSQPRVMSLL
ncbi:bifunctional epoxide hydrolase 2-like [Saccoglossus kowalevskii]|uniref:Bifunctional epoxide hydrolase 2-like n=1 Tax=Saccoglossus kowalevskii TaxID=10224 RepID=A0ABM0MB86_SACKO|nr:PREDICTED: bifunctional epoxide hydrolase 2-like [Saccoglossus kowalevskii]